MLSDASPLLSMVLSSPLRTRSALRFLRATSKPLPFQSCLQRRCLHLIPPLTHEAHFAQHGVGDMLTKEAFDIAWTEYQGYTLYRLNKIVGQTQWENLKPLQLVLQFGRQANMASTFNHASMAHNNHMFFKCLTPAKQPPGPNSELLFDIERSFSSLESLRTTFLATANAMFGPGFVWLVKRNEIPGVTEPTLAILTTYIAGSPYPGAHFRKQGTDMATANTGVTPQTPQQYAANPPVANYGQQNLLQLAGNFGPFSGNEIKLAPGGADLEPMLCVNTWEHVWLVDYGVGGKRKYLERWWERIDWDVVASNVTKYSSWPSAVNN